LHSPIQRLNPLPWNIGPLIPTLRQREQRDIPLLVHPLHPICLLLARRLKPRNPILSQRLQRLINPLRLELRATRPISKRGRCLRPIQEEQVREVGDRNTHARLRAVLPVISDRAAVLALDVQLRERAGHGVEARGEDEDVDFDFALRGAEALLGDFEDGIHVHVDDVNVVLIHDLVEPLLQRGSLGAPWMRWLHGCQKLSFLWIGDPLADGVAPESVGLVVCLLIEEHVLVGIEPILETALLNKKLVVELITFFLADVEGVLLLEVVREARECGAAVRERLFVYSGFLVLFLLFGVQRALIHRQAVIWCSLVDCEMLGRVSDLLDDLNARGTCAELCNAFTLEVHAVLGPYGGMVDIAAEVAETGDWGGVSVLTSVFSQARKRSPLLPFGCETNAWNEPAAPDLASIRALHEPHVLVFVESGTINVLVELDILQDVPLLLHMLEVAAEILPASISFFEGEIFPQFLVEKLIDWSVGVNTGAGIAIPIPDAA